MVVVIYGVNNFIQTPEATRYALANSDPELTEVYLVDNGSEPPYSHFEWSRNTKIIRYEENIGGNAVFHRWRQGRWFGNDIPEFLAFLHCDLYIREKGWDKKVINAFDNYPQLALQGFVGSNEIDERGGRGGGTMLNYLGAFYPGIGQASKAEQHGRREAGLAAAAVLDHCSLIFRTSDLVAHTTPQEGNLAPEHFYDRILCCEILKAGKWIAVNGISCDHFSGGIAGGIPNAAKLCRDFLDGRGIAYSKDNERSQTYIESEKDFHKMFLETGFIPLRVKPNQEIEHQHIRKGGFWYPGWNPSCGRMRIDGK
jgi:hypothetical protein